MAVHELHNGQGRMKMKLAVQLEKTRRSVGILQSLLKDLSNYRVIFLPHFSLGNFCGKKRRDILTTQSTFQISFVPMPIWILTFLYLRVLGFRNRSMVLTSNPPNNAAVVVRCQLGRVNGSSGWSATKFRSSAPQMSLSKDHSELCACRNTFRKN